jgi:hypothetical protein
MDARTLTKHNAEELTAWCGGKLVMEHDAFNHEDASPGINVPVGDNVERASVGDMIIRETNGTFRIFKNP